MSEQDHTTTDAPEDDAAPATQPETLHGVPVTRPRGETVLHPTPDQYLQVISALRAEGYVMLVDVCGVDYLTHPGRSTVPAGVERQRFEIVVQLRDLTTNQRVRVRVQVPESEPSIPSIYQLYPGAEALEREAYDMFGVVFTDHPDPTRILMPESWQGHPLRKDYPVGEIPVQFKGVPSAR